MMMPRQATALLAAVLVLGACAHAVPGDDELTLRSLDQRPLVLPPDKPIPPSAEATIAAYRDYLRKAPAGGQQPEALRRLGDLEMQRADESSAAAADAPGAAAAQAHSYQGAISSYQDLLAGRSGDEGSDHVLYQLAHAQELSGNLEGALAALDRLVIEHPRTPYLAEAQFRRGELLFNMRRYVDAERAYGVLVDSPVHTPYFERALYMQGWSRYKQDRLEDALQAFFSVLDLKLIARRPDGTLEEVPGLSRADRELVEDTLRVTSLCLENLQGAQTIPAFMNSELRHDYEYRIYEELGALYLVQDRAKDAADAYLAFTRQRPLDPQAPQLFARVLDIYRKSHFDALLLQGKKDLVENYGAHSAFREAQPEAWQAVRPIVKTYLLELAQQYHAAAQKGRRAEDYEAAFHWYRELLAGFPADAETAAANFLLAELLFENGRFTDAAAEYENTAYQYLPHEHSADAGYAALLAYARRAAGESGAVRAETERVAIESAQRFADAFPADPRVAVALADAAEKLYARQQYEPAGEVAARVLHLDPAAPLAQRLVAQRVEALAAFDSGNFEHAEQSYRALLPLLAESEAARPAEAPPGPKGSAKPAEATGGKGTAKHAEASEGREGVEERIAASIYKQGEQARAEGRLADAVRHFRRVGEAAPASPVRALAQFDAAAVLIAGKQWDEAARTLEDFRARYPGHPLQGEVGTKLAYVYVESARWAAAAGELERLAEPSATADPATVRAALWQVAEFREKAQDAAGAARAYERYLERFARPLEPAIEARVRLQRLAHDRGDAPGERQWLREILKADEAGGAERTERTRFLAAHAALTLAEPVVNAYQDIHLVEPLKDQLKKKKAKLEDALQALAVAANYGVADVATAAAYRTAALYQDFGKQLLASERPKGLSAEELEQYNVLLEEQAFPFEEKAIALHEANARHSGEGVYDQWVQESFRALAQLRPLRYGKSERSEGTIDAIR